jgi:2-keto-4-pentenoate hydratase/2-oxohepta-3-ene-1,7-dioic acid hydratase in catechol pathway
LKKSSNTSFLINDIPAIIYHLSNGLTLESGDLISTGTPSGVGFARTPQEFLKPGDVVEVEIAKVGVLRNPVVDIREL